MNITELKAKLKAQDPSGWFVICGEEEYLKRYYRNEIKKLITSDTDPFALFNHSVFDGGADFDIMGRSLKAQMKYADKIGARYVCILGDSEIESGKAVLKEMATSEQTEVELDKIAEFIRSRQ